MGRLVQPSLHTAAPPCQPQYLVPRAQTPYPTPPQWQALTPLFLGPLFFSTPRTSGGRGPRSVQQPLQPQRLAPGALPHGAQEHAAHGVRLPLLHLVPAERGGGKMKMKRKDYAGSESTTFMNEGKGTGKGGMHVDR